MNWKIYIYIILGAVLSACGRNVVSEPNKLLSEKEMEDLMYDLAIIDAIRSVDSRFLDTLNINPYDFIYEKHNIDSLLVVENMIYYASLPKTYDKIIKNVETRLEKERENLTKTSEDTKGTPAEPLHEPLSPIDSLDNSGEDVGYYD